MLDEKVFVEKRRDVNGGSFSEVLQEEGKWWDSSKQWKLLFEHGLLCHDDANKQDLINTKVNRIH
jgi:hypothetical protein